jgi:hypothetical protein
MRFCRFNIALLFVIFVLNANGQNVETLEKKNGFRKFKIGADIRNYENIYERTPELEEYFSVGLTSYYSYEYIYSFTGNDDDDKLGGHDIYAIYFKVDDFKITRICVVTDNHSDITQLLIDAFGEPTEKNISQTAVYLNSLPSYLQWSGANIDLKVTPTSDQIDMWETKENMMITGKPIERTGLLNIEFYNAKKDYEMLMKKIKDGKNKDTKQAVSEF